MSVVIYMVGLVGVGMEVVDGIYAGRRRVGLTACRGMSEHFPSAR